MRQKVREENKNTYDPVCLSDIESNNKWITENDDKHRRMYYRWIYMNILLLKRELHVRKKKYLFKYKTCAIK